MSTVTKTLMAALATLLVAGGAYAATTPGNGSPATNIKANPAAVDVKGPCDEAEHANDPRCAGPQVPEDGPNRVGHHHANHVRHHHANRADDNPTHDVNDDRGDDNPAHDVGDDNPGERHDNRGPGSLNSGPGNADDRGDEGAMHDNSGPGSDDSGHQSGSDDSGSGHSGSDDSGSGGSGPG